MKRSSAATTAAASSGEAAGAMIWSLGRRLTMGSTVARYAGRVVLPNSIDKESGETLVVPGRGVVGGILRAWPTRVHN